MQSCLKLSVGCLLISLLLCALFCCLTRVLGQGQQLELLHKTQIEGIPGALAAFKGRLLAGVGPVLRLYELGKKKLLRKCEYKQLPQHVAQLHVLGSRIFVGDVQVGGWLGPDGCGA
jgi:splicing factor 3B subunit 3